MSEQPQSTQASENNVAAQSETKVITPPPPAENKPLPPPPPEDKLPPPPPQHLERRNPLFDLLAQFRSLGVAFVDNPWYALLALWELLVRFATGVPIERFSKITPELYVSGQYRSKGKAALTKRGITAVVNLRTEYDDAAAGIAPPTYLRIKTVDNTPPTIEQLKQGVDFIHDEIERGGKVYIHCAAGVGRAPTLAAAYLISRGLTVQEAWGKIRAVRPFIRPTQGQRDQIDQYAEQVKNKKSAPLPHPHQDNNA
jgi:protein-tyrosine phosphatase